MSAETVIDVAYAVLFAVAGYVLFRPRRTRRPYLKARWDDVRQAWVNEEPHDVGPDGLRLLEDLDAHLDSYEAAVAELYEPVTPVFPPARQHPGLALLRAAVLDEQQKGESA